MVLPVKKVNHYLQGDPVIWVVFFLLCMISLIEVFSSASSLSYSTGNYMRPLYMQAFFLSLGALVVVAFHHIPCRFFKIIPIVAYPLSVIMLILTLLVGTKANGGARWLDLGVQFQPSEFAKGVLVITVALVLSYGQTEKGADKRAMKIILWLTGIVCGLIFTENLSTAVLLFTTVLIMMFVGRVPLKQMARLMATLVAIGAAVVLVVLVTPDKVLDKVSVLHRMDTWVDRVSDFCGNSETQNRYDYEKLERDFILQNNGGELTREQDSLVTLMKNRANLLYLREHAQEAHADIAIASSNGVGKMPGNSEQRDYLAQAYSDFIYAIIIEEMGIVGGVAVVFLYIVLLFRTGRIASRCERNFPAFLAMGLAILIVLQAMMNVLVAVGLAPVTGQPLPLISRGGTSIIINSVYFGMILSVSHYARKRPEDKTEAHPAVEALPAGPEEPAETEAQDEAAPDDKH